MLALSAAEPDATVLLLQARVIKVARKNQLKTCLRASHRQLRRTYRKQRINV